MGEIYPPFFRIKNALFVLFVVLLVLLPVILMATCDLYMLPNNDGGQGMARLAISLGDESSSRKLFGTESTVNHYEVVFYNGINYYQAEWDTPSSTSGTITIPTGYYTVGEDAFLFAGKDKDGGSSFTLMGVGIISKVDDKDYNSGENAYIFSDTTSVTFIITALTNNVTANTGTTTFRITDPGSYATDYKGINTTAASPYPVFPIPGSGSTDAIKGAYGVTIPHSTAVILSTAWTLNSAPYTGGSEGSASGVLCTPDPKTEGTALTTVGMPATCTFTFEVYVSGVTDDGLWAVSIDAPVYALSPTARKKPNWDSTSEGSTNTWHIRGGIDNETPDGISGDGGAVLLGVGLSP